MASIRQSVGFRQHVAQLFHSYAAADTAGTRGVVRANTRLVEDCRSEGQLEGHTVISDEPAERGGTGQGPAPLPYFLASLRLTAAMGNWDKYTQTGIRYAML